MSDLQDIDAAVLRAELARRERVKREAYEKEQQLKREMERAEQVTEELAFRDSMGISAENWPKICEWFYDRMTPDRWGDVKGVETW